MNNQYLLRANSILFDAFTSLLPSVVTCHELSTLLTDQKNAGYEITTKAQSNIPQANSHH